MTREERGVNLEQINRITEKVIGCAIEVHRNLGPGLLEGIYEAALCEEMESSGMRFVWQAATPVLYKGKKIGEQRMDLVVEDEVVVELKAVEKMDALFEAQLLSYLHITGKRVGLLINFNSPLLKKGIKRLIV